MAILKHIASKNADYGEAERYLIFQHDEYTQKPVLDEYGHMMIRDEYYLDGINCDPFTFAAECQETNTYFHKNQSFNEIKSHHYIISFDPKDRNEHGLTGEQAQQLGVEYAKNNFPGHQALVCTHTDGHNGSGNIHVHIVINSLRKYDVEPQPFMEFDRDAKAGYKHHLSDRYRIYLKQKVMDMCKEHGLNQVDLLTPAERKISEKEYWAKRRGQQKLDEHNASLEKEGLTPRQTTFQTEKERMLIRIPFSIHVEETELTRKFSSRPFVPSVMAERNLRCEEILTIQAMGLKKRLAHAHAKSAVVGISGGLDSTLALLVSAKAFDALGMDRSGITAVTMPCFGTTDRTYQNACKMSLKLGATLREIPVGAAVEQHFKDIGHDPEDHSVTYENSQARERTQVLMDVANQTGGIVIGTGDMSELALGWATYNGDHMSMYGVNASVPKTLVRHLVHYYADTCKDQELKDVLYDVLDTPVSPELLPPKDGEIAQKTEDLVGPYELHDFFLYYLLRFSYEPGKIYRIARYAFDGEYDDATIYKWLYTFCRRFFIQQFKRSCLPDGPKVGTVALSPRGDWRMPSDACAEVWLRDLEKAKPVGM